MAEAIISVYAQFPQDVVPNAEHNFDSTNWEWEKCLTGTFPVSELDDLGFSLKPYRWIRFATGIVMGVHGELCVERDFNSTPIDYDSGLSAVSIDLFYHTTDEEKRRMFPIDPKLADSRTITSSGTSTRRADLRDDVEHRDESCVVTGGPSAICKAAHLLPHSKGDTV